MCNEHPEFQDYKKIQIEMFDKAADRGWPYSRLAKRSGLCQSTIYGWTTGTAMPTWAFSILCRYLPDDVSSLMLEPSAKTVAAIEPEASALDDFVTEAAELVTDYAKGRHPQSPGGVHLIHTETIPMKERIRRLGAMAPGASK